MTHSERRSVNAPQAISSETRALLMVMIDFLLDPASVNTLGQALERQQPLDLVRMLAQQWSRGLSTLPGDFNHQHSHLLSLSDTKQFAEALAQTLRSDSELSGLRCDAPDLLSRMKYYLQRNMAVHAAWCSALLWKRPHLTN